MNRAITQSLLVLILLVGCGEQAADQPPATPTQPAPEPGSSQVEPDQSAEPVGAFLAAIAGHCGQSFAGVISANEPPVADDPFADKALIMHVRDCADQELRIPFHVGEDRSRTWILTRVGERLQLKHDHRHADGSHDAVTMYGGLSDTPGSAMRQQFPVDADSRALFEREGLSASLDNTWAMEIEPGRRFLYELSRPSGRLFRVEFDLSQPVEQPPAAWGHE